MQRGVLGIRHTAAKLGYGIRHTALSGRMALK